jgi:uncharacterized damage-inducible protein DinB
MPSATDILIHSLTASKEFILRFCGDLKPDEYLYRPTPKANCVAWLLGHLALTDRRILTIAFGVTDLPALPEGFEKQFSREEGCPQAEQFGDVAILLPLFAQTRDRLIARVLTATPEELDRPITPPHPRFKSVWEATNFMGQHTTMHAGQITIIRRSLGRPPII